MYIHLNVCGSGERVGEKGWYKRISHSLCLQGLMVNSRGPREPLYGEKKKSEKTDIGTNNIYVLNLQKSVLYLYHPLNCQLRLPGG